MHTLLTFSSDHDLTPQHLNTVMKVLTDCMHTEDEVTQISIDFKANDVLIDAHFAYHTAEKLQDRMDNLGFTLSENSEDELDWFEEMLQPHPYWHSFRDAQQIRAKLLGYDNQTLFNAICDFSTPTNSKEFQSLTTEDKAWLLSLEAYMAPNEAAVDIINHALSLDPNCIEAHLYQIGMQTDLESRIDALDDLVSCHVKAPQEKTVDLLPSPKVFDFKQLPYLRAQYHYALELKSGGYIQDALDALVDVLDQDPTDHLEVRNDLLTTAVLNKEDRYVSEFVMRFPAANDPVATYALMVHKYLSNHDDKSTKHHVLTALRNHPAPLKRWMRNPELDDAPFTPEFDINTIDAYAFLVESCTLIPELDKWLQGVYDMWKSTLSDLSLN